MADFKKNKIVIRSSKTQKNQKQQHRLQDKWVIWGHELNNQDWTIESYKKLYEFDNIENFWVFFNNINHFTNFMLFVMRDDILPIYEDKQCENGGFYSYVVKNNYDLSKSIKLLLIRMIGGTLTDREMYHQINGMSVSPKGPNAVIKIWNKNKNQNLNFYLPDSSFIGKYRYRPHVVDKKSVI